MTQLLEAADLLADFRKREDGGALDAEWVERQAARAADLVISFHRESDRREHGAGEHDGYPRDAVTLLCEITSNEDQEVSRAGVRALFPGLIERLNDSFDPAACDLYDRIFAQVIDYYRRFPPARLPQAREFDNALRGFGLMNEADLLGRKSAIRNSRVPIRNPQSQ